MFINKYHDLIDYAPGDLLIFSKKNENVQLFLIKSNNPIALKIKPLLKNRKHFLGILSPKELPLHNI